MQNYIKSKHAYIHLYKQRELLNQLAQINKGHKTTFTKNQILTYLLNK